MSRVKSNNAVAIGEVYGRLTIIGEPFFVPSGKRGWRIKKVECLCECGNKKVFLAASLRTGNSKSCGCSQPDFVSRANRTHGDSNGNPRLYRIWRNMNNRCNNPKFKDWMNYGGRGIRVCKQWRDYAIFREWSLSHSYRDDLTLDRFPNQDGNYEPSNCRWATFRQQMNNTRTNRFLTIFCETKTIADWSRDSRCVVTPGTFQERIKKQWEAEKALVLPKQHRWSRRK